jgi:hypothetical protein
MTILRGPHCGSLHIVIGEPDTDVCSIPTCRCIMERLGEDEPFICQEIMARVMEALKAESIGRFRAVTASIEQVAITIDAMGDAP